MIIYVRGPDKRSDGKKKFNEKKIENENNE